MATTGQAIREALNERIATANASVVDIAGAERVDELCEFRVIVNQILATAGELPY